MKLKLFILLISSLFTITGTTHTKCADSYTTLPLLKQIEAKADKELKFNKLEINKLKPNDTTLNKNLKVSQKDLIYKYREKAMNDPNTNENPKKVIYGQGVKKETQTTKTKTTQKKTTKAEKKPQTVKKAVKKKTATKPKTQPTNTKKTQAVKSKRKVIKKTQPKKENLYAPNSIIFNGRSVRFYQSAYDYFDGDLKHYDNEEEKERNNKILDKRLYYVDREIKHKNVAVGPVFSRTDGQATYILGHNPGTMSKIARLRMGSIFEITDWKGRAFKYQVIDYADFSRSYNFVKGHGAASDPFYFGYDGEAVFISYCRRLPKNEYANLVFMAVPVE